MISLFCLTYNKQNGNRKKNKKYYVRVRAKKLNLIEDDVYSKWVKKSFKVKANKKAKK